jgi:hypothetical protein
MDPPLRCISADSAQQEDIYAAFKKSQAGDVYGHTPVATKENHVPNDVSEAERPFDVAQGGEPVEPARLASEVCLSVTGTLAPPAGSRQCREVKR